jgi:hypothetical protein
MRGTFIRIGFCSIIAAFATPAFADDFAARLGRVPVDSRTQAAVAGLGHATAVLEGNTLTIEGEFAGLLGPASSANLHMGVAVAARGPVIRELTISTTAAGELSGEVELSRAELAALRAGRLYIQVASESAPEGNLWGWLFGET